MASKKSKQPAPAVSKQRRLALIRQRAQILADAGAVPEAPVEPTEDVDEVADEISDEDVTPAPR